MYGDYENQDPVAVEKLASVLQRRTCVVGMIGRSNIALETNRQEDMPELQDALDNSGGGLGSGTQQASASSHASSQAPASSLNQIGPTSANDSLSKLQSSSQTISVTASQTTARNRRFFELCVNTGEIDICLGEIDITNVRSDGELFKKIYERYKDLRGYRIRRIFLKPVDVHFIHVSSTWYAPSS
jgi:hypothetical protein